MWSDKKLEERETDRTKTAEQIANESRLEWWEKKNNDVKGTRHGNSSL